MKKIYTIFILVFLCFTLSGCNTITGTAKGLVDDVKSILPGI